VNSGYRSLPESAFSEKKFPSFLSRKEFVAAAPEGNKWNWLWQTKNGGRSDRVRHLSCFETKMFVFPLDRPTTRQRGVERVDDVRQRSDAFAKRLAVPDGGELQVARRHVGSTKKGLDRAASPLMRQRVSRPLLSISSSTRRLSLDRRILERSSWRPFQLLTDHGGFWPSQPTHCRKTACRSLRPSPRASTCGLLR